MNSQSVEHAEHETVIDLGSIYAHDIDKEWLHVMEMCDLACYPWTHRVVIEFNRHQP